MASRSCDRWPAPGLSGRTRGCEGPTATSLKAHSHSPETTKLAFTWNNQACIQTCTAHLSAYHLPLPIINIKEFLGSLITHLCSYTCRQMLPLCDTLPHLRVQWVFSHFHTWWNSLNVWCLLSPQNCCFSSVTYSPNYRGAFWKEVGGGGVEQLKKCVVAGGRFSEQLHQNINLTVSMPLKLYNSHPI